MSRGAWSAIRGNTWSSRLLFGGFALTVTLLFFLDGMAADYSALSSDQYNILAMCAKLDHPRLLEGDLIVGHPEDTAYYTPLFVAAVRVASLPDHDYLRGLNILLAITSLVYMFGWWVLFSMLAGPWMGALAAFLARGIMWPPGNEVWGIAGIWSLVPRTPFLALLPLLLWFWIRHRRSLWGWITSCVMCGLLANVHPISGAGVAVSLLVGETAWALADTRQVGRAAIRGAVGAVGILIGLAPYAWIYLTRVRHPITVDVAEFDRAIAMRIPIVLRQTGAYWHRWARPQWFALVLGPWAAALALARRLNAEQPGLLVGLGGFAVGSALVAATCFPVEHLADSLGWHARFAFQLIRVGKYVIVPSVIIAVWITGLFLRQVTLQSRQARWVARVVVSLIIGLTLMARSPWFDRWPVLGDDVIRLLWPPARGARFVGSQKEKTPEQTAASLLPWIRSNTSPTAKFVGPRPIRAGALRAVVHDWAGAVVLIEGNPDAFVEAAHREAILRDRRLSGVQKSRIVRSWGADYWVTDQRIDELPLAHESDGWFVYHLDP